MARVKGHLRDLLAFQEVVPARRKRFEHASRQPLRDDPIRDLSARLHPRAQHLIVNEIRDETASARTYQLVCDPGSDTKELAYFRAGQYLSLKVTVDGFAITRAYSVSSAPIDALRGYYEITVRKVDDGFFTPHIWDHWIVGTQVECSGPEGFFYHDPLRDSAHVLGLAGGSGVTPFRSMAREIVHGESTVRLTLLCGSQYVGDIIFGEELAELERRSDRIRVVFVLSGEGQQPGDAEQGLLTAELMEKYAELDQCSIFVCGPTAMHRFVAQQLSQLGIPRRRIRKEVFGQVGDGREIEGFPSRLGGQTFQIKAVRGNTVTELPAAATETVLVALERAKLRPPSSCRSGECGLCRGRLVRGEVFVRPEGDGRRAADVRAGYIHCCASFPVSDLEIEIP